MDTFFRKLFEYNHHFNTKLANSFLADSNLIPQKSLKLFCHILNAHEIWNSRIQGKPSIYGVWDVHDPKEFGDIMQLNQETTNTIIKEMPLDTMIQYSKNKGAKKVSDVLFHIINHSTYHRAQIAMDFKENGIEPIATDYIHFEKLD